MGTKLPSYMQQHRYWVIFLQFIYIYREREREFMTKASYNRFISHMSYTRGPKGV